MKHDELLQLSKDRELATCELHTPNDFYGHATILKQYAGLPPECQLKTVIEHAPFDPNYAWKIDLKADMPLYCTFSSSRHDMLREHGVSNPVALGPLIHYAKPYLTPQELDAERKRLGRCLLVFPSHSSHLIRLEYDVEVFRRAIDKEAENFDTVRICLFWKDILQGAIDDYADGDYEIVSAGHMFSPEFLPRLKSLIMSADMCMASEWGTFIGYSLYLDKPLRIHNVPYTCHVSGGDALQPHHPIRRQTMSLFECGDAITEEQLQAVASHWGFADLRPPEELREILESAEKAWTLRHT
jgi:hypothetical protein